MALSPAFRVLVFALALASLVLLFSTAVFRDNLFITWPLSIHHAIPGGDEEDVRPGDFLLGVGKADITG